MLQFYRAAALAALLALCSGVRANDVITLTSGEWLPYMSPSLPHYGPLSRIVSEAFALEGVEVRYVFRPWSRAYVEATAHGVNGSMVWSVSPRDSERRLRFYLSDTVLDGQSVFFHLKSYPFRWAGYTQLVGVRLGGTAGYEYAFDRYPGMRVDRAAASDEQNFVKLAAGRFDVFPANLDVGRQILRGLPAEQAERITWDPHPYNITHYYLLLNKVNADNQRYLALFNRGLRRLKASGKYAEYLGALK
ncbi:transporter substrate-binding domain-containing protein [Duganella sp. FT80W]|uniref:Transporter substrate-binding domain-containing protein n=1 Tax=Duganella guangzhouensis TaxID=2666084 RepID=A0A6I2KTU7_9BURK|nr:transporter substrate-binding domain-containing protein [Duganella guangzhouensis]MRW88467.1 transporter substrate-binding domain-containing protein [Duganella guangzhouensis]